MCTGLFGRPASAINGGLLIFFVGCATAGEVERWAKEPPLWRGEDSAADVRLAHPAAPEVQPGTFDLVEVELRARGDEVEVIARFRAPVRPLTPLPEDAPPGAWFLPTVDVYLDLLPDQGHLDTPEGRHVTFPVDQGWERALVLTGAPMDLGPDVAVAMHLTAHGRELRGRFPRSAAPGAPRGVAVLVLATAPGADGAVRPVGVLKGDCSTWDASRCTLRGDGPPVLDAIGELAGELLLPLRVGEAPAAAPAQDPVTDLLVPVVFQREAVVTVAPIPETERARYDVGALVTLLDEARAPTGSAVVVSRLDDAATLQRLGTAPFGAVRYALAPRSASGP